MDWTTQAGDAASIYHRSLVPAIFLASTEVLLDAAGPRPGDRVLDVACGTGVVTRAAAARVGPQGGVLGVDLGEPMLAVARAQEPPADGAPIEYVQGDAQALPVGDGTFDVAVCQHGVMFFSDRSAAVAELARAVRPGGTLALAAWCSTDENPAFGALVAALEAELSAEAAAMMATPFCVSGEELGALLGDAGAQDVAVTRARFPARFGPPRDYAVYALLANPAGALFREAPAERQDAVREHVATTLAPYVDDAGDAIVPATLSVAVGRRPA